MPNHLINEKSPYLLQHAGNPVDWFPWGDAAFGKARSDDKPIFLSVGYSTCHWCHVMEKESFEDPAIAAILNEHFVAIKVDREERPDVDRLYMSALQAMGEGGGWPMSMFLTPDLKPFWGGTYFPPVSRYGRAGFGDILKRIAELWSTDRAKSTESAQAMMSYLNDLSQRAKSQEKASSEVLDLCFDQLEQTYDSVFGGFGGGPKFPRPVTLLFLLRYYVRTGSDRAREMVEHTLERMAAGGVHDHVGGGFHRYAVDREWRVPHFEKMLYDQAQLLTAYTAAYQVSGREEFAQTGRRIAEYVLRDISKDGGGFFSAEDADSPKPDQPEELGEGAFYIWTSREIREALGAEASTFAERYGLEEEGNALHDPQQEFTGRNILYLPGDFPADPGEPAPGRMLEQEERWRRTLLAIRSRRPRPRLDDKVLTSWNGLMISAMARAAAPLGEAPLLEAAERSAEFILTALTDPGSGMLLRRFRDGESRFEGYSDDYAFMAEALIDLYESTGHIRWLKEAVRLTEKQVELFWDTAGGGFYDTSGRDRSILFRSKEQYDGAEPTGNSVSAMNLLRLSAMTGRAEWKDLAGKTFEAFSNLLTKHPVAVPHMASALDFSLSSPVQVVLAGEIDSCRRLARGVFCRYLPNRIVLYLDGGEGEEYLVRSIPSLRGMHPFDGRATAYVCRDFICRMPTTDPEALARLLDES